MILSDEQLNVIMDKADDDLERLKDRCHDLYEENERLKKANAILEKRNKEIYDGFMATQEELTEYAEENERLKDSLETMTFTAKVKQEAVDSLISRIDKAIEYINNGYLSDGEMVNILARQDLLNILQGEDNE